MCLRVGGWHAWLDIQWSVSAQEENWLCTDVCVSTKSRLVSILAVWTTVSPFRPPAQNIKCSFLMLIHNHPKHFACSCRIRKNLRFQHVSTPKLSILYLCLYFVANPRQRWAIVRSDRRRWKADHTWGIVPYSSPSLPPSSLILSFQLDLGSSGAGGIDLHHIFKLVKLRHHCVGSWISAVITRIFEIKYF